MKVDLKEMFPEASLAEGIIEGDLMRVTLVHQDHDAVYRFTIKINSILNCLERIRREQRK